jgi:hypothetical protein
MAMMMVATREQRRRGRRQSTAMWMHLWRRRRQRVVRGRKWSEQRLTCRPTGLTGLPDLLCGRLRYTMERHMNHYCLPTTTHFL